jgi:hypothetical protein
LHRRRAACRLDEPDGVDADVDQLPVDLRVDLEDADVVVQTSITTSSTPVRHRSHEGWRIERIAVPATLAVSATPAARPGPMQLGQLHEHLIKRSSTRAG